MSTNREEQGSGGGRSKGKAGNSNSPRHLLLSVLPERVKKVEPKLRAHLTGKIVVELKDSLEQYVLDWAGEEFRVEKVDEVSEFDCKLTLTGQDFVNAASGALNPQVAMLSHKIHVAGRMELAVYFFNLFSPNERN